jgi:hypothetical protein
VKRILVIGAIIAAAVYLLAVAGLYLAMKQPPERFGAIMARVPMPAMMVLPFRQLWMSARSGPLSPGDPAPDFELPSVDHSRTVRLSNEYREKPVVLVFGSYT